MTYRNLDGGVKQMVVNIPRLAKGEKASVEQIYECTLREILPPEETADFVIPAKVSKELAKLLLPSPYIESNSPEIKKLAPEIDRRYRWSNEGLDCSPAQLPLPPDWLLKLLYDVANGGSVSSPRTDDSLPSNAIPAGQRNSALASIAGTMRRVGMSESEILAALHTANNDRSPKMARPGSAIS